MFSNCCRMRSMVLMSIPVCIIHPVVLPCCCVAVSLFPDSAAANSTSIPTSLLSSASCLPIYVLELLQCASSIGSYWNALLPHHPYLTLLPSLSLAVAAACTIKSLLERWSLG